MTIDRRKLFQLSGMAGLGFAGSHLLSRFGGLNGLTAQNPLRHFDAYGAIKDALLGGPSSQRGLSPPTAHRTVLAGPHTALHFNLIHFF